MRKRLQLELPGLVPLAAALLFSFVTLLPELRIGELAPNDAPFHAAAAERLADGFRRGEPFLDPWVSEWALGYPLWRSYQPLPHLLAAGWMAVSPGAVPAPSFAHLSFLLLVLLPVSVYCGARLLGLRPLAAGLASCLTLAPAGSGTFASYGLGLGAYVWRGSGLYTQLVALHLLLPCLGLVARALDTGARRSGTAILLALTSLSHIVFGYVSVVSAAILALVGPAGQRSRRALRLAGLLALFVPLVAFFVVPLLLSGGSVNHSRWEPEFKWDSFGARLILGELASGRLLDAGRPPFLTILSAVGALVAALSLRDVVARRLLSLTAVWAALFFGRATWGHLLLLAGVPRDLHLHRLQAAFEVFFLLAVSWGLARLVELALRKAPWTGWLVAGGVAAALVGIGRERASYLAQNTRWGEETLLAYGRERADLDGAIADIRTILAERPGRVSAGKAATWGRDFRIGHSPVYSFLTRERLDQVSFLYHSMSRTSDVMVLRDEASAVHDTLFGVRAVLAPADHPISPGWRLKGRHGRFAVYEASAEGYFGLVDVAGRDERFSADEFDTSSAWLRGPFPASGLVLELGPRGSPPRHPATTSGPRGTVLSETKVGESYRARVSLLRPCHALVKITWDPWLSATVDGVATPVRHVTPGFAAVKVPAGHHEIVVRYAPGLLRPLLLLFGLAVFGFGAWLLPRLAGREGATAAWLAVTAERLATPRRMAALAVLLLGLLALRPLYRGLLVAGHDATEYPPRLAQFALAVAEDHVPPVWAKDLGNGFGQPLFGFAPPLLYAVALPLRLLGLSLTDSTQLALALLNLLGAAAVYRLGRRWPASRAAAVVGAACWLFAPYLSLDLFVRAAFAEASAVAVAPVALLGVLRAMDRPGAGPVAGASFGIALVMLGHNGAALLVVPALVILVAFRVLAQRRFPTLVAGLLSIGGGLALSSFYWLPALLETGNVKVNLLREGFLGWREHILEPWQLLVSPWGYGLSVPGTGDGMSFAVGLPLLLLGAWGVVRASRHEDRTRRAEALALAAVATLGALLSTTLAAPLWSSLPVLQYLAYPWRALLLPALALPVLAIPALSRMSFRPLAAVGIVVVLVNVPHTEPSGYSRVDEALYTPESIATRGVNTTTREEYEPRWVRERPPFTPNRIAGMTAPVVVVREELRTARQRFLVYADAATDVEAATFFYPGWRVAVDGSEVPLEVVPERGTIRFRLPRGEHTVELALRPTPLRWGAAALSLLGLLAALLVTLMSLARGTVTARDPGEAPTPSPGSSDRRTRAAWLLAAGVSVLASGGLAIAWLRAPGASGRTWRPVDTERYVELSAELARSRRFEEALAAARAAKASRPDSAEAHAALASSLAELGRWDEALASAQEALRLRPSLASARASLARIEQGQESERRLASAPPAVRETPASLLDLSLRRYQEGRFQECIDAASRALELQPGLADAWNNIAVASLQLGRLEAAEEAAREAIRLAPDHPLAKNNLAWILDVKAWQAGQRPEGR